MTLPVCNEWHLDSSGELATPPACPGSDRELDTYEAVFLGRAKTAVPSLSGESTGDFILYFRPS